MELLRYFETFLVIFLSLIPSLLDVGVQVWNVVSVNTMFKHTKCKDPTGYIANGHIYCDGDSRSLVCDVECMPGYVPSYGGGRSVCTHGDWSVGVEKMHCDQGLVIIAGGSLQGAPSDIVEVYGPDGFYFPNLPNSSIFTGQSGEMIDVTNSTLEYVGDGVLLCGSDNLYSSSSQQRLSDHCLGVRRQEDWRLHSALRKNRTQALSTFLKNRLILLAGDEEFNNSTEYLNPGSLEWRDGFSLDHPISGACVEKFNRNSFVVVEYTRGVTIYKMDSGIENVIESENIIAAPTDMDPSTQFDCKVFQHYSRTLLMLVQGGSKSWTMDFDMKSWINVTSQFSYSPTVHLEFFDSHVHVFGETKNVWSYNADAYNADGTVGKWEKSLNTLASQRRNYATAVIPRTWFTEQKHSKEDADDEEEEDSNLKGKILFSIYFSENFILDVTYVGFISIVLIQLPGFCLAFHGIGIAFLNHGLSIAALKDAGLSSLFVFYPFFLVEILAMFEILWEEVLGKVSSTVILKLAAIAGIQHILKINDKKNNKKTKLMYLLVTKVYFGSCLQFCFQAILYFGYTSTEDQSITQVLSLCSSGIMIVKLGTDAFLFQRKFIMKNENEETKPDQSFFASIRHYWTMDKKAFVIEKAGIFKDMDKRKYFIAKLKDLMNYVAYVPLVATGALFHMGCLILSSLVLKEFVVVYILAVFLSNLVCVFFPPLLLVQRGLDKIPLKSNDPVKYTADKDENDEKKIQEKRFSKGLFMCWSNIFMSSRIVENISYIRYIYFLTFQPIHFIINIIVLITCVSIDPSTIKGSASLAAVGTIHIFVLLWTFYQQFLEKGKREARTKEHFRDVKLKQTTGCFTCAIFATKKKVKEGSDTKSNARNGKTETRVNMQQNK